jgi:hypothetical protein
VVTPDATQGEALPLPLGSNLKGVRHRALILGGITAVAIVIALFAFSRSVRDVDRARYVRLNLDLLERLPTYPGAKRISVLSRPWRLTREPFHREYIAGYSTDATYEVPYNASPFKVLRFYEDQLRGWRPAGRGASPARFSYARPGQPTTRCYVRGDESVCIETGVRSAHGPQGMLLTVAVDHRLYYQRQG